MERDIASAPDYRGSCRLVTRAARSGPPGARHSPGIPGTAGARSRVWPSSGTTVASGSQSVRRSRLPVSGYDSGRRPRGGGWLVRIEISRPPRDRDRPGALEGERFRARALRSRVAHDRVHPGIADAIREERLPRASRDRPIAQPASSRRSASTGTVVDLERLRRRCWPPAVIELCARSRVGAVRARSLHGVARPADARGDRGALARSGRLRSVPGFGGASAARRASAKAIRARDEPTGRRPSRHRPTGSPLRSRAICAAARWRIAAVEVCGPVRRWMEQVADRVALAVSTSGRRLERSRGSPPRSYPLRRAGPPGRRRSDRRRAVERAPPRASTRRRVRASAWR